MFTDCSLLFEGFLFMGRNQSESRVEALRSVDRMVTAEGYCQVDENRCDRPTRYCGRSPSWADMLDIRIGL